MFDTFIPVIVESRYAPSFSEPQGTCACQVFSSILCVFCRTQALWRKELDYNIKYARLATRDCLLRGEAPFVSHLLYTQPHILKDTVPEERNHGIRAGFAWRALAKKTVVYTDLGISPGMQLGIEDATAKGHEIEYRTLPDWDKK
jgi:hypothetical protein